MVLQWTTKGDADMGVHKQSVSFTDSAFNFARELVESKRCEKPVGLLD